MDFQRLFPRILIILSLLCAGVSIFFQAKLYLPVNDDSCYQYILGEYIVGSPDNDYSKRVDTFDDLVTSQINHYLHTNGRAVVHTIVQALIAYGGWDCAIPLFIGALMISTLVVFIIYSKRPGEYNRPLPWVLAVIIWLLMYPGPDGAFYRLVFAMNYLYPMFLCLCFLLIVRRIEERKKFPIIVAVIVSFLTGWSQEGFSFPLCGAMLVYLYIHRQNLSREILFMTVFCCFGALLLLISPGNFNRVVKIHGPEAYFIHWIDIILTKLPLLWIELIVIVFSYSISPAKFKMKMRETILIWLCIAFSLMFSLVAHTGAWSLMNIEFFVLIVMFSQFPTIRDYFRLKDITLIVTSSILVVILMLHQAYVIKNFKIMRDCQDTVISQYVASVDGVVLVPIIKYPKVVMPWIYNWIGSSLYRTYSDMTVTNDYGSPDKPFTALLERDYEACTKSECFFVPTNKVEGNSPYYEGEEFYWARLSELENKEYEMVFAPVKLSECPYLLIFIKAILTPDSFDRTMSIVPEDTIVSGNDSLVRVRKTWRTVTEIRETQRPDPL